MRRPILAAIILVSASCSVAVPPDSRIGVDVVTASSEALPSREPVPPSLLPIDMASRRQAGVSATAKPSPTPRPTTSVAQNRAAGVVPVWHTALASSYGINDGFSGGHMACGGRLDTITMTVAHRTLRCGTKVQIRFRGHTVTARVEDRGPWVRGRDFDLGPAVARGVHFNGLGIIQWRIVP